MRNELDAAKAAKIKPTKSTEPLAAIHTAPSKVQHKRQSLSTSPRRIVRKSSIDCGKGSSPCDLCRHIQMIPHSSSILDDSDSEATITPATYFRRNGSSSRADDIDDFETYMVKAIGKDLFNRQMALAAGKAYCKADRRFLKAAKEYLTTAKAYFEESDADEEVLFRPPRRQFSVKTDPDLDEELMTRLEWLRARQGRLPMSALRYVQSLLHEPEEVIIPPAPTGFRSNSSFSLDGSASAENEIQADYSSKLGGTLSGAPEFAPVQSLAIVA